MIYTLLISASPDTYRHRLAIDFARSLKELGHSINCVFFWHDATLVAQRNNTPARDELNIAQAWRQLLPDDTKLISCIASSVRRGVLSDSEAKRYELDNGSLATGFSLAGLGSLVTSIEASDRLIRF